ncbi:MAG: ROK family protein [bacterium]
MVISVLGVDVGGTKVAAGPVDRAGSLLASPVVEPSQASDTASFLAGLETTLRRALAEFAGFGPRAIGLACAGTVDSTRGLVVTSPNLPLEEVPLAGILGEAFGIPVILENDANAAVLGEAVTGAAAGLRHVVMLTLGTGVGGGLFVDGMLFRGAGGGAGELGHTIVRAEGHLCRCGAQGCLEMYASGSALVRYAAARAGDPALDREDVLLALQEGGKLTGAAVTRLARKGHAGALDAVRELAGWLGIGLLNMTNIFNPEMIVVGGGVGELGELLLEPAREVVRRTAITPNRDQVRIAAAMLGNRAGLVGGGLAAWEVLGGEGPSDIAAAGGTAAGGAVAAG